MKTLQEIFDTAYLGLAKQGFRQSVPSRKGMESPDCLYRGKNDRKCAIGHCIPDELYEPCMDDPNDTFGYQDFIEIGMFTGIKCEDFRGLQSAHDDGFTPQVMKKMLAEFAKDRGLSIPQIEGEVQ